MFKLVALKVLQAPKHEQARTFAKMKKVLHTGMIYRFCSGYETEIEDGTDNKRNLPDGFFSLGKNVNRIKIHVSAIVGKNGDGKSSIVELVIRMLNNLAYAVHDSGNPYKLLYVKNIYAQLFFEIDGKLCYLKVEDDELVFYVKNGEKLTFSYGNNNTKLQGNFEVIRPFLFYTLVFNESMFAYNSLDFYQEADASGEVWIDKLFHKKDGYQIPIVLNPARDKGNIDVNIENMLTNQRMLSMFITQPDLREAYHATKISCRLRDEIPFYDVTLRQGFRRTLFTNLLKSYSKGRITTFMWDASAKLAFWQEVKNVVDGYLPFAKFCLQMIEDMRNGKDVAFDKELNYQSDMKEPLKNLKTESKMLLRTRVDTIVDNQLDNMNFLQWLRIIMVAKVVSFWEKKLVLNGSLRKLLNLLDRDARNKMEFAEDYDRALLYLVYKTIDSTSLKDFGQEYTVGVFWISEYFQKIDIILGNLYESVSERNFGTLRLRQIIFYIKTYKNPVFCWNKILKNAEHQSCYSFAEMKATIDKYARYHVKAEPISIEEMLPPHIYEVTPLFDRDGMEVSFQGMSSGERQLLMVLSGILYHVRNIDEANSIQLGYQHINLILEEIELYSHPEYQRQFVTRLIEILENADLGTIRNIGIIMVTHSPFILSDIPKSNVLFLENGKPVAPMQENSFGANIHSLLKNGFFLSGMPMGDFAKRKINDLFAKLNSGNFSREEYLDMEKEILMVGEPYLRGKLLELYGQFVYKLNMPN